MPDENKGRPAPVRNSVQDLFQDEGLRAQAEALAQSVAAQSSIPTETATLDASATPAAPAGEGTTEGTSGTEVAVSTEGALQAEAQGQSTEEPPTTYFGVDLSDFEPEKRTEIIGKFKEQDKFIQKLMQRQATEAKTGETPTTPTEPAAQQAAQEPVTDEQLLSALGIAPDDDYYDVKAGIALPLAKQLLQTQTLVNEMYESQLVDQTTRYWNDALDGLEKQYGVVPGTRDELFEYAALSGITDPQDAYWRIAGPARRELSDEATKARQETLRALKLSQGSGTRPTSAGETSAKGLEAKTVREATKEAARQASRELGFTWESALAEH